MKIPSLIFLISFLVGCGGGSTSPVQQGTSEPEVLEVFSFFTVDGNLHGEDCEYLRTSEGESVSCSSVVYALPEEVEDFSQTEAGYVILSFLEREGEKITWTDCSLYENTVEKPVFFIDGDGFFALYESKEVFLSSPQFPEAFRGQCPYNESLLAYVLAPEKG